MLFKGLIMDGCVFLTSTPECVVSPRRVIPRAQHTTDFGTHIKVLFVLLVVLQPQDAMATKQNQKP